ncbi:MAG: 2OG-Fe(II) oxygenase [Lysobacterales bacterium]
MSVDLNQAMSRARDLVSGQAFGSDGFFEGMELLNDQARSGSVEANVLLGHLHCQYPGLPDAPAKAHEYYQEAVSLGDPLALLRLADLAMFGYGQERNDVEAFDHITSLAAGGYASALCQQALMISQGIGCKRDDQRAASLVLQAAAQGDTLAFALLAERYLDGLGVPQRPDLASAWLALACRRQFPGAERRRQQLTKQVSSTEADEGRRWAEKLMDNIRGLGPAVAQMGIPEHHPEYPKRFASVVAENFARLDEPALSLDAAQRGMGAIAPQQPLLVPQAVSWSPRVFQVDRFADAQERLYLLAAATGSLVSSAGQQVTENAAEVDPFDGECAVFSPQLVSPIVRIIQRRWAHVLHIHEQHFEPMSVLRYSRGHEYSPHVDYFDANRIKAHREIGDLGGQRLITGLIYLIASEEGGETTYGDQGPTIRGQDGSAVFHFNTRVDGLVDAQSVHAGRPVTTGEKWLCRTAVRENNVYLNRETVL